MSHTTEASPPRTRTLSEIRLSRGYQLAVRVFGSAWFLLLGLVLLRGNLVSFHSDSASYLAAHGWAGLVSRTLVATYYLILWALIVTRPAPVAQSEGVLPSATAFLGTYLPLIFPVLGSRTVSTPVQVVSSGLLLGGGILTLMVLLHLGRSFSLVPQARRLIRNGPYRLIRHPLYVAEEISICGVALSFLSPWTAVLFFVHCAIQVRRMLYEESVLMRSFPEYRAYAASTARVIPRLW